MKKIFSVVLAVLMISSCLTSAFSVFAADDALNVKALIESFNGDMTKAEPSAEDLAAYNEMVSAYNALTAEEKDRLDVIAFDKLLLTVYDREVAILKAGGMSNGNAMKQAHVKAEAVITMPSYVATAAALYTEASNINSQAKFDAFVESLKNAPEKAAVLAGGYYKSYSSFRYSIYNDKYGAELIFLAANKLSSVTEKADSANKPASPKSVSKPNASKFELGEEDPAYIEAYKLYLAYKEAQAEYYADLYAFEFEKHYLPHLKVLTEACPYFSFVYDICKNAVEAKRNFNENEDTAKIAEVMAVYNTLSPIQVKWFESVDGTAAFAEKVVNNITDLGTEYKYNSLKMPALIEFCVSMEFFYTVQDFENAVNGVELPYTNDDIAAAKAAYNAVPEALRETIDSEIAAKYKEILASVGPDASVDNEPDLGAYPETDVSYKGISEKDAEMLANATIEVILNAAGVSDFRKLIDSKVLTNSTVVALAGLVYPFLYEKTAEVFPINIKPADVAVLLTEEKFAGAVEALNAAGDDWAAVAVESGDLGFADGDAEGFLDAAAAILRGGATLLNAVLQVENKADTKEGTYTYGAYEELIEVFEILDLDAVKSSAEYTEYVNAAELKNDAKFRAILAPVVYLFAELGNDPVNIICDVLPKLAYAIDSGIVNTRINNILDMFQLVEIDPVDLTTAGIYTILSDALLVPQNIALSQEEFSALIKDLAGCGTAVAKPSVQRGQNYRMGIESDRAKTIVVLMSWILDVAGNNAALVNTLLDTFVNDNAFLKAALKLLIGVSTKFIPRKVIFLLASIFIFFANIVTKITGFIK
ncbi:MAG: hypothetical protein UHM85_07015 [Acutalibacteraceae bacterium]|nr:hypothetical protein [Acutalibacteraceae bacterium]